MAPSYSLRTRASGRSLHSQVEKDGFTSPSTKRVFSLQSKLTEAIPANTPTSSSNMVLAYMVCGVGQEPCQWVEAPSPGQGKLAHQKGSIPSFFLPEILGSSPSFDGDSEMARALHASMRACFPNDVEIVAARNQPPSTHHSFVIQQNTSQTLYGVTLKIWSRANSKKIESLQIMRRRSEVSYSPSLEETYWIPHALSFLSRYPLYDLLGDYLRGMWTRWKDVSESFDSDDVARILALPAPRLNDLVTIEMKDYTLCYQFPSSPTGFQNFLMWPLFQCLSVENIVEVLESALSPTGRLIFISRYPAMLTVATETVRMCVRGYEWSGLYIPIVHSRHVGEIVQQPGPFMLGIAAEARLLFTPPADALLVDLDRNLVQTSSPPNALAPSQRQKMMARLITALNGETTPTGVPNYLRSAYYGDKHVLAGQILRTQGEIESIRDPEWWDQKAVMAVLDRLCAKQGRNTGVKAIFSGSTKKPLMTKVSVTYLNKITRERNQYSHEAADAWQDLVTLKERMDTEITKVNKRNNFLNDELDNWKDQFLKFQAFAKQLTKETQDLKTKIENYKGENKRLTILINQQKEDAARLTILLAGTEKERDEALAAISKKEIAIDNLEREKQRIEEELTSLQGNNVTLLRQRDEARRVVQHLHCLVEGQTRQMLALVNSDQDSLSERVEDSEAEAEAETKPATTSPAAEAAGASVDDSSASLVERRVLSFESRKKENRYSMVDAADKQLRSKTDAIADIIKSISEQCSAAAEGLQLANLDDTDDLSFSLLSEDDHNRLTFDHDDSLTDLPDLVDTRSRTSMSTVSGITTPVRQSLSRLDIDGTGSPSRIIEHDDETFNETTEDILFDSSTPPDEKSGRVRGIFNFKTRSVGGKTPSKSKRLPHTQTPERSVSASLISTLKRS